MSHKYFIRSIKTVMLAIFILQLTSIIERQVFDLLGYMWASIIGNFLQFIAVIFGLFGVCQQFPILVIMYVAWSLLWSIWNIFVICLYLEVGVLTRSNNVLILTLGTHGQSWWLEHGFGCGSVNTSLPREHHLPAEAVPLPSADSCLLHYHYVEVIHAAVQLFLSVSGLVVALIIVTVVVQGDEGVSNRPNDELQFVKIHNRGTQPTYCEPDQPIRSSERNSPAGFSHRYEQNFDNIAFDSDDSSLRRARPHQSSSSSRRPTRGMPPSYDTSVRNTSSETLAANRYYASDRRSVRSKGSTRSKRSSGCEGNGNQASGRSQRGGRKRPNGRTCHELPWVQITPSAAGSVGDDFMRIRHY